jgi:hypothetical protein
MGMTGQRQFSTDLCADQRWVLLLDSDESLEPRLRQSVREVVERDDPAYDGWMFNRKIWFLGGWLHHVFQPEWRLRLVRSGQATVTGGEHDRVEVKGRTGRLAGDCRHDSWIDAADMCRRYVKWAEHAGKHQQSGGTALDILTRPPAALLKQLVLKGGWRDGWRGVIAAGCFACGTMMKHLMIAQRRHAERTLLK